MDKTFDEAIAGIRKAERGVEVREDIAQGMEYVKGFADTSIAKAAEADASASSAAQALEGTRAEHTQAMTDIATAKAAALKEVSDASGPAKADAATATQKAAAAASSASAAAASQSEAADSATAAKASKEAAEAAAKKVQATVTTDKTLSISGAPADAKTVGDKLKSLTLPAATSTTLGGVKVGSNLTVSADGTVSMTGENIGTALGFTPTKITCGSTDLVSGGSYLETGTVYLYYQS